jgi:penicillin-binding protein 1C
LHSLFRAWLIVALLLAQPAHAAQSLPSFDEVRATHVPSEARIVDRHGAPLSEIRLDPRGRRLEWVSLRELSPAMLEALLAAEDRRFYEHGGVDWRAVAAALWQNLWYDHRRGASTLSMQLAGLLDPALRASPDHGGRRTLGQKWDQALAANALEAAWSKEQILEAYLNLAPFRGELSGVPAAAWGLFRKTPATLGRAEAAVLAVLLRGPNAAPALVARRACLLVRRLDEPGACGAAETLSAALPKARFEPRWNLAPELARRLLRQPGEILVTTLEREAQLVALTAVTQGGASAVAVVDNASAGVLALAQRSEPGTPPRAALLPLVYGLALERKLVTAASLLPLDTEGGAWISLRGALAAGLAEPAAQIAGQLEPHGLEERLRALEPGAVAPADLLALAGLYRSLAMGGQWLAPHLLVGDPQPARRLLRPEAAFVVAELLAEPQSAWALLAVAEGGQAVAVAFDAGLTVAVAVAGEAEAARGLARNLLAGVPHAAGWPRPPPGVVQQVVVFDPPVEAPRREWFLRGTEIALVTAPPVPVRIVWPPRNSVVDVREELADPGFELVFEARPGRTDMAWRLNGVELARGPLARWRPVGGLAHLELLNGAGELLDEVNFAVRVP